MSKVNAYAFGRGDVVRFEKGGVWRGLGGNHGSVGGGHRDNVGDGAAAGCGGALRRSQWAGLE